MLAPPRPLSKQKGACSFTPGRNDKHSVSIRVNRELERVVPWLDLGKLQIWHETSCMEASTARARVSSEMAGPGYTSLLAQYPAPHRPDRSRGIGQAVTCQLISSYNGYTLLVHTVLCFAKDAGSCHSHIDRQSNVAIDPERIDLLCSIALSTCNYFHGRIIAYCENCML